VSVFPCLLLTCPAPHLMLLSADDFPTFEWEGMTVWAFEMDWLWAMAGYEEGSYVRLFIW
jgi:hypothetical protein